MGAKLKMDIEKRHGMAELLHFSFPLIPLREIRLRTDRRRRDRQGGVEGSILIGFQNGNPLDDLVIRLTRNTRA